MLEFVKDRFFKKFPEYNENDFYRFYEEYENIKPFKVSENIYETGQKISKEVHYIMRLIATYHMNNVFKALKIDINDENVKEDLDFGNIGSAGRIVKMYTGSDNEDYNELMSGRWNTPPRMAKFPNENNNHNPVFVKTDLNAVCSHHFIRFGEDYFDENSFIVIGYIPEKFLGGISKINRFVNWCARRGWLQEDLTRYIGKKIEEYFETTSVYVGLFNLKHGCSMYRGACDIRSATTTIYVSGEFEKNPNLIPPQYRG